MWRLGERGALQEEVRGLAMGFRGVARFPCATLQVMQSCLGSETHPGACPLGTQRDSEHPGMSGVESVWILRTWALVSDALSPANNFGLFLHLEIEMIIPTT